MNEDWAIIKSILRDESNDDFDFQLGLSAWSYELVYNVFEDLDVPPHLVADSKPIGMESSHDTATNSI